MTPLVPTASVRAGDGVAVAVHDLGGTGPTLLLAHATGFCGAVLAPLAARLGDRFHAVAFDERGHGDSDRPPGGVFDWDGFGADVLAVVDHLGGGPLLGFGHSCGGAALLLAEQARPGTFSGLYLYEPVVMPHDGPPRRVPDNPLSRGARRRRPRFDSRQEAMANFAAKPPFSVLAPDVLAAYVDNGFRPDGTGGITLKCQREDEADVYAGGFAHQAFEHLPEVAGPVTLACGAETDSFGEGLLAACAARLPDARTEVFPGLGHFGPLQDPDRVAAAVAAALSPAGDPPRP